MKDKVWWSVGMDLQGDHCLYGQRLDENGDPVGFLSEEELEEFADILNFKAFGDPRGIK